MPNKESNIVTLSKEFSMLSHDDMLFFLQEVSRIYREKGGMYYLCGKNPDPEIPGETIVISDRLPDGDKNFPDFKKYYEYARERVGVWCEFGTCSSCNTAQLGSIREGICPVCGEKVFLT